MQILLLSGDPSVIEIAEELAQRKGLAFEIRAKPIHPGLVLLEAANLLNRSTRSDSSSVAHGADPVSLSGRQGPQLVTDERRGAAIVLMHDLIRRAKANEVTILAVTEHETMQGRKRHLEITYAGKGGVKQ